MTGVPQIGRIHPLVWSKAARGDDNFIKNHLSAHFRMSLKTVLVIAAAIASFFLLLMLLG